ncbi:MAG: response regulator [Rickettsiaceae bacterium]|jgi:CheY-like chemotaxis protein|nr:response regulator [Rickettsiaceae bacterium]
MSQLPDKQKVILFIDDEKICHTLVELIVPNFTEYKLVGAFSGKEAIMLAKRYVKELSLILSDIMLPDINGYEVYNTLRADSRFTNVPFVFQSGIEAQEQELRKNITEEVRTIYKPYKQEELLKIIKELAK